MRWIKGKRWGKREKRPLNHETKNFSDEDGKRLEAFYHSKH